MRRVYLRCNDGHLFLGESCPFDGWGSPETARLARFVSGESETSLTLANIRGAGFSDEIMRRVVIIEFGDDAAAFQAIAPEYYFLKGTVVHRNDVGPEMT
jgi:hypothetical protein